MPRRSNKWISEILTTPSISSSPSVESTRDVHTSSQSSIRNDNIHDIELDRKIALATEGFTTHKFCIVGTYPFMKWVFIFRLAAIV